jgi:two-component system NtrC family response regulator
VCATHRDLQEMVAQEEFREDLMYRINTFEIHLPPLRNRLDDIPELAKHLLQRFRPMAKPFEQELAPDAVEALKGHVWPGNVRELANVIEHATILCESGQITAEHLPPHFNRRQLVGPAKLHRGPITLRELEMDAIHEALERNQGNKPRAAEELGVSLKTLYNKLNQSATLEKTA